MTKYTSPVEYFLVFRRDKKLCETGVTATGWYFWNEDFSYCYGPYESNEKAYEMFVDYSKEILSKKDI